MLKLSFALLDDMYPRDGADVGLGYDQAVDRAVPSCWAVESGLISASGVGSVQVVLLQKCSRTPRKPSPSLLGHLPTGITRRSFHFAHTVVQIESNDV